MGKYQILVGSYTVGKKNDRVIYKPRTPHNPNAKDIIETDVDLLKFNSPNAPPKFKRLDGPGNDPAVRQRGESVKEYRERLRKESERLAELAEKADQTPEFKFDEPTLQKMSIRDLMLLAKDEGIEVAGVSRKSEIIRVILAAAEAEAA